MKQPNVGHVFDSLERLSHERQAWLEAARAEGKPIPRPRYRPVIYQVSHLTSAG